MVRRIGMREFRANMAGFLRQVHAGSTFLVTSRDEVLAEIHLHPDRLGRLGSPAPFAGRSAWQTISTSSPRT